MASPGDKKRTKTRLVWPYYGFFFSRCREIGIGDDECVENRPCVICDGFTQIQKEILFTPTYKLRKEKKTGVLVSPEHVKVIASVEDKEPAFHSPPPVSVPSSAHAHPETSTSSFVISDQLKEISDQWAEQFARFEALFSRGNVFSTPKAVVNPMPLHTVV